MDRVFRCDTFSKMLSLSYWFHWEPSKCGRRATEKIDGERIADCVPSIPIPRFDNDVEVGKCWVSSN